MEEKSEQPYDLPLPKDMIFEIFLHLPVKSLVRLSSVCKLFWNLIASNKDFVRSHLKRALSKDDHLLELLMYSNTIYGETDEQQECNPFEEDTLKKLTELSSIILASNIDRPILTDLGKEFFVAGYCDGVICFYKVETNTMYLCNPALHQCTVLETKESSSEPFLQIAGFGRDHQNLDHKAVRILLYFTKVEIELYSLNNNSWTSVIGSRLDEFLYCPHQNICSSLDFNGCLHWIVRSDSSIFNYPHDYHNSILTFNIADEELDWLPIPSSVSDGRTTIDCLGVLNGDISLISAIFQEQWEVWSMKTYGVLESWTKIAVIPVIPDADPDLRFVDLVGINRSGKILFDGYEVIAYDLAEKKWTEVKEKGIGRKKGLSNLYFLIDYVESLISVKPLPSY